MYRISLLKHYYQNRLVLDIEEMTIDRSAIIGLVGANGSGKSTLLRLLAFIEKPCFGTILFKGRPLLPFSDEVRFNVSLLPQMPYLLKRSVFDNIIYGLKLRGVSKQDCRDRAYRALSDVGLDVSFAQRQWYQLSGGEAQRVALAARLVLKPEVLLMDEPTASVDAHSSRLIQDAAVRANHEQKTTLVIASHDRAWLNEVCTEPMITLISEGKYVRQTRYFNQKGAFAMCEANAYLVRGKENTLVMESVDSVEPSENGLRLVNIFGEQKFVKGYIESLSLVDHKIFLKEHSPS